MEIQEIFDPKKIRFPVQKEEAEAQQQQEMSEESSEYEESLMDDSE